MARRFEIRTALTKKSKLDIFNLFSVPVTSLSEAEQKQVAEKFAKEWFKTFKKETGSQEQNFKVIGETFSNGSFVITLEVY